jgi:PAS domain S-box-containing protein
VEETFINNVSAPAEMFRELVENSGDVTIVTDRDYKIRYISSSVADLFGKEPMALLGKPIFEFIEAEVIQHWQEQLGALATPTSFGTVLTLPVDRRQRTFSARITNSFHQLHVQGMVIKLHDVTELKVREQKLIESNQHLDQVFYKTTHDLIAPLRSALGLVNLAAIAPDEQRLEYLALIKRNLLKLDNFIEEMNDFFRGERLEIKREKIDVRSLISEEIDNLRNLQETTHISIETNVRQRVDFYSDLFRIRTIITNLVSNAIKYSDLKKEKPMVQVEVAIDGNECLIVVQDNGIGIEEQYQQKIYERFFRGTSNSYGNGIGLFIVKDTVERLQGTIQVSSVVGAGTAFTVAIPNQSYSTVL